MNTPIDPKDIRKGDRIRIIAEYTSTVDGCELFPEDGDRYELIERPVQLPTVPGLYLDKDGEVWNWEPCKGADYLRPEYAPFTLLRPVAEVAAEVLAEVLPQVKQARRDIESDRQEFATSNLMRARRTLDRILAKWATS